MGHELRDIRFCPRAEAVSLNPKLPHVGSGITRDHVDGDGVLEQRVQSFQQVVRCMRGCQSCRDDRCDVLAFQQSYWLVAVLGPETFDDVTAFRLRALFERRENQFVVRHNKRID